MEKKNVNVLLPTVEQLRTMKDILNREQFHDANVVFDYSFAKMVEWTIANGGLEKCPPNNFPEGIAYLISRSTALLYPEEAKYVDLPDVKTKDTYRDIFRRDMVVDAPSKLDDLAHMKDSLKTDSNFLDEIIVAVDRELYSANRNGLVKPNNVRYRFDHIHDSVVRALFEGKIFELFNNGYVSEDIIKLCAKIEPLYLLKRKAEDLVSLSGRHWLDYANEQQTVCLRSSINHYSSRYGIMDMYLYGIDGLDSDTDLMDESNVYCRTITSFFNKHSK